MGKSDEVRRLLDERGVEHRDNDANRAVRYTRWDNGGKREVRYEEWSNGTTRLDAGNVTPEQAIAATVGAHSLNDAKVSEKLSEKVSERSCASCPEMDNPDSYISHLQSALDWHDRHVPRPTNPRNTCVVLEGEKVPEEVLFIGANGVTHYLPEATCHLEECEHEREIPYDLPDCDGGWYTEVTHDCDECGYENVDPNIRFCGGCGRRVVAE